MTFAGGRLSKLILKNSSLNAGKTVIVSGLTFVTTKIYLDVLGPEQYGLWALIIAFASYANFLELGFNNAVTRLVASEKNVVNAHCAFSATSDAATSTEQIHPPAADLNGQPALPRGRCPFTTKNIIRENPVINQINSTVITYIMISAILFVIFWLFLPFLKNLLFKNIALENFDLILLGTLACFLINLITSNYLSVLTGRLRMDFTNFIALATNLTQAVVAVFFLYSGWGINAMFAAALCSSLVGSALAVLLAKREMPALSLDFKKYDFSQVKSLMSFSLKIYFVGITQNFVIIANKFLIKALCGLSFVTYYEIAWKLINQIRVFFQNLLEPLYPASSMIVSGRERSRPFPTIDEEDHRLRITSAYKKAFKYLIITSSIAYGAFFLFSYPLILVWLGKNYVQVSLIAIIIGVGNWLNLQTASGFYFLASMNRLHSSVVSAILAIGANFALSLPLWHFFGFWGLIAGFSLALVISGSWFIKTSNHELTRITGKSAQIHE